MLCSSHNAYPERTTSTGQTSDEKLVLHEGQTLLIVTLVTFVFLVACLQFFIRIVAETDNFGWDICDLYRGCYWVGNRLNGGLLHPTIYITIYRQGWFFLYEVNAKVSSRFLLSSFHAVPGTALKISKEDLFVFWFDVLNLFSCLLG